LAACAGLATTLAGIGAQTLLQLAVDDAYRGRVMSFWVTVSFGVPSVGATAIGAVGEWLGMASALTAFGLAGGAITAALLAARPVLFDASGQRSHGSPGG
ncbi:MAG: hypothetical protein JSW68_08265, partial [Burkholderiales bacterium]